MRNRFVTVVLSSLAVLVLLAAVLALQVDGAEHVSAGGVVLETARSSRRAPVPEAPPKPPLITTTTTTAPPVPVTEPPPPPPPPPPPVEPAAVAAATAVPEPEPPPAPEPSPPPPRPSAGAPSGFAQELLAMHNQARASSGLAPLSFDGCLNGVAQSWSEHMVSSGRLAHSNLSGGFDCGFNAVGENIAMEWSAQGAFDRWMASGSHRAAILNGSYTHVGIGVATASDGSYWITVEFGG